MPTEIAAISAIGRRSEAGALDANLPALAAGELADPAVAVAVREDVVAAGVRPRRVVRRPVRVVRDQPAVVELRLPARVVPVEVDVAGVPRRVPRRPLVAVPVGGEAVVLLVGEDDVVVVVTPEAVVREP